MAFKSEVAFETMATLPEQQVTVPQVRARLRLHDAAMGAPRPSLEAPLDVAAVRRLQGFLEAACLLRLKALDASGQIRAFSAAELSFLSGRLASSQEQRQEPSRAHDSA